MATKLRTTLSAVAVGLGIALLTACGGGSGGGGSAEDRGTGGSGEESGDDSGDDATGATFDCDVRSVDGLVIFEAERLPINEDWREYDDVSGFSGDGFIVWDSDQEYFNDPTHGVMTLDVRINEPGRYTLTWYAMVGKGSETTEHNDTWVKFPDADDAYGLRRTDADGEDRRYAEPQCKDDDFTAGIEALDAVDTATCVDGSSRDGWLKVYSIGADDWKWTGFTSDNDQSAVKAEFDEAGTYELMFAARSSYHRMDRIVLYREDVDANDAEDRDAEETLCE